jgi:hypothetical protein
VSAKPSDSVGVKPSDSVGARPSDSLGAAEPTLGHGRSPTREALRIEVTMPRPGGLSPDLVVTDPRGVVMAPGIESLQHPTDKTAIGMMPLPLDAVPADAAPPADVTVRRPAHLGAGNTGPTDLAAAAPGDTVDQGGAPPAALITDPGPPAALATDPGPPPRAARGGLLLSLTIAALVVTAGLAIALVFRIRAQNAAKPTPAHLTDHR